MHIPYRFLLGVVMGVSGMLLAPPPATAQARSTVSCGSIDGKFNRCALPWDDARLVRQESKATCTRGQSWGVDRHGVWVDRGCRGVFAGIGRHSAGGGWRPGPGWDRQIRLQCESGKQRYQLCQVDVGGRGQVQLVKQISDARCTKGYSWGWNRAGVWVDHGCRGQFMVDRRW